MKTLPTIKILKIKKDHKHMERVFDIRWTCYPEYRNNSKYCIIDEYDYSYNCALFLAVDEEDNTVGTLRILDRRMGIIELDEFINVDYLLSDGERPSMELSRLAVSKHPDSEIIKQLLFKTAWLYSQTNKISTIFCSYQQGRAKDYVLLNFRDVGIAGVYYHPHLQNSRHHTYKLHVSSWSDAMREDARPYSYSPRNKKHAIHNDNCKLHQSKLYQTV